MNRIIRACLLLYLILPDQPNRRIRTRTYGGVGGTPCEGRSYPDVCRAKPGYLLVLANTMTQVFDKVHTQPDGGEG